mmetsp:Transcript_13134/g.41431  ORF Transcript_13134/g.41431 Transcript_13134/m.41431 type:complete len:250 (+) Transcript_13134:614-1363(+)
MWLREEEKQHNAMKDLRADCRALRSQRHDTVRATKAVESENEQLRREVEAAKDRLADSRRVLEGLSRAGAEMSDAIGARGTGMTALKFQFGTEVSCLAPGMRQTCQRRQQAETLHLQRLGDIQTATRAHKVAAASAAASARSVPAVPLGGASVEASRPPSSARLPASRSEGCASAPGSEGCARPTPESPHGALQEAVPRAMLAPAVDLRTPELRGRAAPTRTAAGEGAGSPVGGPMSARLGHAGRLVVG